MQSNNVTSAVNQQERLVRIGWVVGFVDGEGCFSIGFVKQPDRQESTRMRRGYKLGYQVSHEFAVAQGAKSLESLKVLQRYFGIGSIHPNRRYDNHKEDMYRFTVRRRDDLLEVIIPFFQKYQLLTVKRKDFEKFVQCVQLMKEKKHLTQEGIIAIAKITSTMNRGKTRTSLIRILRDYTSDPATSGEEIVRSA